MPVMNIMIGVQASGKSSFANSYLADYQLVSLDKLKTRNKENLLLAELLSKRENIVVDNTNPTKKDREKYIKLAKDNGYRVVGYYLKSSLKDCLRRNSEREDSKRVPKLGVLGTYSKLEIPELSEGYDKLYYVYIKDNGFVVEEWGD